MKRPNWLLVTGAGLVLVVALASGVIGALGWGPRHGAEDRCRGVPKS